VGAILTGADNSGGAANAFLTDTLSGSFINHGVAPDMGMVLYNTTQATSGTVTAVTDYTITAAGVTWDDGDAYRIVLISAIERSTIEHYLNVAASDLHAAMHQSGACECTLASWATDYLAKLNIIDAAAYHQCKCAQPKMDSGERQNLLTWASTQLEAIRTGNLELCHGATGADFPAIGWAQQAWNDVAAARIIWNYERANS